MNTMAIRIALRHEGAFWNAYLAKPDTMDGALLVGSIAWGAAQNPEIRQGFMDLMHLTLSSAIKEQFGVDLIGFEVNSAPEHEKAGHA